MDTMNNETPEARLSLAKLHDWLAVGLRHRRLVALSFLGVFLGAIVTAILLPPRYVSNTKILVKRERMDPFVTADQSTTLPQAPAGVTDMELNSEVELIKSRDLMGKVVQACGLHNAANGPGWRSWLHLAQGGEDPQKALLASVLRLEKALKVEPLPKTSLISITYEDRNAQQAARVLNTLVNLYMEKHLAVHRPAGAFEFFQKQTQQYEKGLADSEARLSNFSQTNGVISPEQQKTTTLQKLAEFQAELKQTQISIAETERRTKTLEAQVSTLPSRMTTQMRLGDNPQLLGQLKSTLLTLELKRTELLQKFEPTYRLVQEVDTQIAQTHNAIEAAEKSQLREETTDRNPAYEWVTSELAKARSDLAAKKTRAEALSRSVQSYEAQAQNLDQKEVIEQDLQRDVKAEEANYLLYLRKQEEARISDALDRSRILNVAVTEPAQVPAVASRSRSLIVLLGLLAGILVGLGSAVAAEYLNPSLRNQDEVKEFLDLPVLASVSTRGR